MHIYDPLDTERCEKVAITNKICARPMGRWREMERPCRICRECEIYTVWDGNKDIRGTVHEGVFDLVETLEEENGEAMLPDGCRMQMREPKRKRRGLLGRLLG